MNDRNDPPDPARPVDGRRRDVLRVLVAASGAAALPAAVHADELRWDRVTDVVVAGSGIAATAAAIAAASAGAGVEMLEKLSVAGGTTARSAGVFWIPNNAWLRSQGIADDRINALRYMARLAQPGSYDPQDRWLGVGEHDFGLLETFVEHAPRVVEALSARSGLKAILCRSWDGRPFPDYFGHIPENKVERGRSLVCDVSDQPERILWTGGGGAGASLIARLQEGFAQLAIAVHTGHRVTDLVRTAGGRIAGVRVAVEGGGTLAVRARRAVVFATGGFTQSPELSRTFLKGHIWGGCAAPGCTGDFIAMATAAGAALGNMANAWWAQVPVEVALQLRSLPANVWVPPGDSMLQVNRYGRRFVNEKIAYNERTQLHFVWDPVRLEYPNRLAFMLWDARTAKHYAGYDPIAAPDTLRPHVIAGASLADLAANIDARLESLGPRIGHLRLDTAFADTLAQSVARFNGYARAGVDEDFHRGETPNEIAWQFWNLTPPSNPYPNAMLHPLADAGPYYAVILGASTLDTKGGPLVNAKGQVLSTGGQPIPGLYAAGNCAASPAGQAYWGAGGTIGPAMTFGYLAGESAAAETADGA